MPPLTPIERSFIRLTMRVGLPQVGQGISTSVLFLARSAVLAVFPVAIHCLLEMYYVIYEYIRLRWARFVRTVRGSGWVLSFEATDPSATADGSDNIQPYQIG